MPSKILTKSEVERGFITIPSADRAKLIGNSSTPFSTQLNGAPARIDKKYRIWASKYLKNKYPVNAEVHIEKNEIGFSVSTKEKVSNGLDQSFTPQPLNSEIIKINGFAPTIKVRRPPLEEKVAMIDASNVAYWGLPENPASGYPTPSYDQIVSAEAYFKNQGFRVLMFADSSLRRYIDKKYELRKREKAREIRISPPDVEADVNILNIAIISYPNALVVTNDIYYDHPELLRKFRMGGGKLVRFDTENKRFIPMVNI